jgi:3-phenylpropionate/trans-cinnamate dioxygenase ferredoxin component
LVRLGEQDVRAVHDTCSHQQQSRHGGTVDGDTLFCAAHAATFDLTTGESIGIPEVAAMPLYACKVEDGTVMVDLGQQLNNVADAEDGRSASRPSCSKPGCCMAATRAALRG